MYFMDFIFCRLWPVFGLFILFYRSSFLKCLFKPNKTDIQIISIAMDNVISKKATIPSAIQGPSFPFATIPSIFPALKTAAIRIPNQFAKVPYNASKKVIFNHVSDNSTLCQINPRTIKKIPFNTP